jgi:hypothetical protein
MKNIKMFNFVSTTSHGYLVVPIAIFKKFVISKKLENLNDFKYSYLATKNVYLEEDQDMLFLIDWYKKTYNKEVRSNIIYKNNIRQSHILSNNYNYIMGFI